MDDLQMFLNLAQIKNEIKDDLNRMDRILYDLDLKDIIDTNKDMSSKMDIVTNNFKEQIKDLKLKNNQLEKEVQQIKKECLIRDKQIEELN
ncbi:MAG: hypothetical protein MJ252_15570, partial [archaeon]|nr:hypothetical protein [archaeon]